MKNLRCLSLCALLPVLAAFLTLPGLAAAYIDPGSGSLLLQVILAAVFGSLLFFKVLWQRIRAVFAKMFSSSSSASSDAPTTTTESSEK